MAAQTSRKGTLHVQQGKSGRFFQASSSKDADSSLHAATAPYNFIPYEPEAVIPEADGSRGFWSGTLHCRLEALTPLLVSGERRTLPDGSSECRFFTVNGQNVIPGSSIKGVLRSLVEILSFSAMRQVSRRELFWRIVTGAVYREAFSDEILGGYLRREGAEFQLFPVKAEKLKHGDSPLSFGERVQTGGIFYRDRKSGEKKPSCDYRFWPPSRDNAEPLDREVFATFKRQMTDSQKKRWNEERCARGDGHPVFYRREDGSGKIAELGLCRYFRLKYAMSPYALAQSSVSRDFAEQLFGRAGDTGSIKGRIAVEPAFVQGGEYRKEGCRVILGTPHPTCLAHYLNQDRSRIKRLSKGNIDPESLAAYRKGERLRGWKMYWHHDVDESQWLVEGKEPPSKKVLSVLHPLDAGAGADVKIRIDRLTDPELGAVLEALSLASGEHALKLGMGKPLGFGSVRLKLVRAEVEDVRKRYASLVGRMDGVRPSLDAEKQAGLREAFRRDRLDRLHAQGLWADIRDYNALPPVKALHAMTNFHHRPAATEVRYMKLKKFAARELLPLPEDVLK